MAAATGAGRLARLFLPGLAASLTWAQEASLAEAEAALAANRLCGTRLLDMQALAAQHGSPHGWQHGDSAAVA
jgi:hypothetical protein